MSDRRAVPKEPTDAELIEMVARRFHVTLKPAGGRTFDVALPDLQLRIELKMSVHHEAARDLKSHFQESAIAIISDPDNVWSDRCDCSTGRKERYSNHYGACSNLPIGVVVYKSPSGTWDGKRYDPDKPAYSYSFRCRTHIDKRASRDEQHVVYRTTFVHAIRDARNARADALKERRRLVAMTPVERIAEDARMEQRPGSKALADEIEKQVRHSYRCARFHADREEFPWGDPSIPCTCAARPEILGIAVDSVTDDTKGPVK